AADQDLFDRLAEAERLRHALSFPEERERALAILRAWDSREQVAPSASTGTMPPPRPVLVQPAAAARLRREPGRHAPAWWSDLPRSIFSTVATTVVLRLCYGLITA